MTDLTCLTTCSANSTVIPNIPSPAASAIPTDFRSVPADPRSRYPRTIDLEASHNSAIFALIDDHKVVDNAWRAYLSQLWAQLQNRNPHHCLYPVALSRSVYNLNP